MSADESQVQFSQSISVNSELNANGDASRVESQVQNSADVQDELEKIIKTDSWAKADFRTKLNYFTENLIYSWSNISATVKESLFSIKNVWRTIQNVEVPCRQHIDPISGVARCGEILAIVGSSGVGKTTLLNILSFRSSLNFHIEGVRCLNGIPVDGRIIRDISSYIQKEDLFIPLITVEEHLLFTIRLRSRFQLTYKQSVKHVESVLKEIRFCDKRHMLIGPISTSSASVRSDSSDEAFHNSRTCLTTGERKLLAIASEILIGSKILFCERPTSDLDHIVSCQIMDLLHRFCAKGNIVIITAESAPSKTFGYFDRVCIMARGRVAFHGSPEEAFLFWTDQGLFCPVFHNPIDHFIATLQILPEQKPECLEQVDLIVAAFQNTMVYENLQLEASGSRLNPATVSKHQLRLEKEIFRKISKYRTNWCRQAYWLYMRELSVLFRSKLPFYGIICASVLSALFYGSLFWQQKNDDNGVKNITSFFAAAVIHTLLVSTSASIVTTGKYMRVFYRETYQRSYRPSCYIFSRILCDLPVYTISAWTFVLISFPMVGIGKGMGLSAPSVYCGIITLVIASNLACSLGHIYIILARSTVRALRFVHTDIVHMILFSGILINPGSTLWPVGLLHEYAVSYQLMENLMVKQWESVKNISVSDYSSVISSSINPQQGNISMHFKSGLGVLRYYTYADDEFVKNSFTLVSSMTISLRTITLIVLVVRVYLHRKFYPELL